MARSKHAGNRQQDTGRALPVDVAPRLLGREVRIGELYLAGGLTSYRSAVETERFAAPFGSFAFGILRHTDLPEVAASLAPRRVCMAGAVDGPGGKLEVSAVRKVYGGAHVVVRAEAKWDVEALS